jgi:hypothetical protein
MKKSLQKNFLTKQKKSYHIARVIIPADSY